MYMCVVQTAAKLISCARHSTSTVNEPFQEVLLSNITKYAIRRLACLRSTITKVQSVHMHIYMYMIQLRAILHMHSIAHNYNVYLHVYIYMYFLLYMKKTYLVGPD